MNRILATIILMLSITSILPAQDVQESTQKKVTIGVDVLPLIGGFANAQFGFLHNNGKNEVSIRGFTGQVPDEDLGVVGSWPSYRLYPIGEGILKGIFFEAGFGVGGSGRRCCSVDRRHRYAQFWTAQ